MKTHESTYALLVRSEEKSRGILEIVLYAFFIMSAVLSIWQFVLQPINVPAAGIQPASGVACQSVAPRSIARI